MEDAEPHPARAVAAAVLAVLSGAFDLIARVVLSLWAVPWRWLLSQLVRVIALPLRLVWLPLSYVASFLRVLFAPALYVASYALSCVNAFIAFVVSLEVSCLPSPLLRIMNLYLTSFPCSHYTHS